MLATSAIRLLTGNGSPRQRLLRDFQVGLHSHRVRTACRDEFRLRNVCLFSRPPPATSCVVPASPLVNWPLNAKPVTRCETWNIASARSEHFTVAAPCDNLAEAKGPWCVCGAAWRQAPDQRFDSGRRCRTGATPARCPLAMTGASMEGSAAVRRPASHKRAHCLGEVGALAAEVSNKAVVLAQTLPSSCHTAWRSFQSPPS